jgi:hypothetical protein
VRKHRNSIPRGAGPGLRPAAGHLTTAVRPAPRRHITSAVKGVVMARKRRAPKYEGALAQPIYVDQDAPEFHRYPDFTAALKEMWQTRAAEKMLLLFKHYKIDPSDEQSWQELAFSLAFEHVPGLKLAFRPKPGRKPTWKTGLGDELVRAVEDVKSRTGKGAEDAIAKLKEEPGGMWGSYTVENLGTRYREAKRHQEQFRKAVEAARELRARGQKLGGLLGLLLPDEN